MPASYKAVLGSLLGAALSLPAAAAPLLPAAATMRNPLVIEAQVQCDSRGCFGFGPQQWHRRSYVQPNYKPPGTPPIYYQPRDAGPPRLYYPQQLVKPAPAPAPSARAPVSRDTRHIEWCSNRYRSYDPSTNSYLSFRGVYVECRSPRT
ncbi:BA14K family protein [Rhizobium sp. BK251]|uniref:BA14K family protein n=1 Tax=Rhizobium sp. BK251 TaxID=2512125 RepID=UPI0010D7958D|nr:BA14K family protein [Rhizobium sp. BK251]TCL72034.1 BA14K-like protein [Rhizobium sp. BK251]